MKERKTINEISFDGFYANNLKVGQNKDLVLLQKKSSHSGSVPEDSGSLYKSPVLYLKLGQYGYFGKVIKTASDQYFLIFIFRIKCRSANQLIVYFISVFLV